MTVDTAERLTDLLIQEATESLDAAERAELARLLLEQPAERTVYERLAAGLSLAAAGPDEPLPAALAARLTAVGEAYVDSNWGHEPLEDAFTDWHWSRANSGDTSCVFYDARLRDGGTRQIALRFENGGAELIASPPHVEMQRSRWGVHRATRSSAPAKIIQTLEDTPFYARSVISAEHDGKSLTGVHESLSLDRFRLPIVQAMLPFRMPRSSR